MEGLSTHEGLIFNGYNVSFDVLAFSEKLPNPGNLDAFITDSIHLLCALQPPPSAIRQLKALLVSGMESDYYWEKTWKKYIEQPDDQESKDVLHTRLRMFFAKVFSLPEYQMM